MARPRKDTTTDNLERQIKKLQERVIKTKEAHDMAVVCANLNIGQMVH